MEKYIQPFIDVTENAFKELTGAVLKTGRPYFIEKKEMNEWDISGVIGLTGEARGAVVISMKANLATKLTGMLMGKKKNTIDTEVVDAVGEIINIIAGNAKKGLEDAFRLVISLPTIVQGEAHQVIWPNQQARIICVPFSIFDNDFFSISVAIDSMKNG